MSLKQAKSPERTVDHHADLNRLGVSLQATSSLLIFLIFRLFTSTLRAMLR
jgi:hypothetical protein